MLAYGASFDLTPREKGMKGAIARAGQLLAETPVPGCRSSSTTRQRRHPCATTAQEILADFPDGFDALITGVGTGGHITGCRAGAEGSMAAAEGVRGGACASPVISGGAPAPHPIQGIGAGFRATNLHTALLDGVIRVEAEDAREMARRARGRGDAGRASAPAPRWRRSGRRCRNCRPAAACSASTTTPASATCRPRASCPPTPEAAEAGAPLAAPGEARGSRIIRALRVWRDGAIDLRRMSLLAPSVGAEAPGRRLPTPAHLPVGVPAVSGAADHRQADPAVVRRCVVGVDHLPGVLPDPGKPSYSYVPCML